MIGRVAFFAALWRSEGTAGVVDRAFDHVAAARRRGRFREVAIEDLPAVPVLRVAAAPPVPWLGGVPAQLGALMHQQERYRNTALLYPWRDGLRLEVTAGGRRQSSHLPFAATGSELEAGGWRGAVERAAEAVGAELLHVEGAAGLPHDDLLRLAQRLPTVLSLHDFALFCPRPNLFDEASGRHCGYCRDAATCHAHLAAAGRPDADEAWGWRTRGAALLAACRCVVYPSEFLRAAHERLFGSAGAIPRVIPPGIDRARMVPWRWPWTRRSTRSRVAFLGGGGLHKGSTLLVGVAAAWARRGLPPLALEVLGGGGGEQLLALQRIPGVRVRGYYRHGSLGRLLRRHRTELALLLPQVPESFSLSLSECLAAGVPVIALAQGALADRLAAGGGHLLPADAGVETIIDALRAWQDGLQGPGLPPPVVPTSGAAAATYARLFDELRRADSEGANRDGAGFHFPRRRGDAVLASLAGGERVVAAAGRWSRGEIGLAELRSAWRARVVAPGSGSGRRPEHAAIVYLPALPWRYRFQRPQQLARAFVGAGHPVLYVEGFQRTRLQPRRALASTEAGVEVLRLAVRGRPDPYREALAPEVAEELALTIAEGVRERTLMVLAQLPFWAPLAVRLRELLGAPLVYDRLDFHIGFPGVAADVDEREGELMMAADLVLASSPVLYAGCEGLASRRALVPNAVDLTDFPPDARRFAEPVTVGYVGALGHWFDAAAIDALAAANPQWRVRLAGRVEAEPVRALARHPNVELLGEIPYSQVAGFLAGLRALLIPFLDLPLTRAVDPVKLYEGLAAGLPVVSCRLPAIETWREPYVYSYEPGGLAAALERAMAEDTAALAARRRQAVEGESWEARAAAVLDLVGA